VLRYNYVHFHGTAINYVLTIWFEINVFNTDYEVTNWQSMTITYDKQDQQGKAALTKAAPKWPSNKNQRQWAIAFIKKLVMRHFIYCILSYAPFYLLHSIRPRVIDYQLLKKHYLYSGVALWVATLVSNVYCF
jgi:hypothetical protein